MLLSRQVPHSRLFERCRAGIRNLGEIPDHMTKKPPDCLKENDMPFDDVGDLGDSIHLWTIPLDGPAVRQAHDARLLSADEAARAARFRFARDRRRFIAGRGAARTPLPRFRISN